MQFQKGVPTLRSCVALTRGEKRNKITKAHKSVLVQTFITLVHLFLLSGDIIVTLTALVSLSTMLQQMQTWAFSESLTKENSPQ